MLRQALERMPEDPNLYHTLGLTLERQDRRQEALVELARASELAPQQARFAYVYGIALYSDGNTDQALDVLKAAHLRHQVDMELLTALTTISRDVGRRVEALTYARRLLAIRPDDTGVQRLVTELERVN